MRMKRTVFRLFSSGLPAFLAAAAGIGTAILSCQGYGQATQYLSELGTCQASAAWFNWGLVATGILLIPLFISIRIFFEGHPEGVIASMAGMGSAVALGGVGIFTLDTGHLHYAAAGSFFVLSGLTALIVSLGFWKREKKFHAASGIAYAAVDFIFLLLLLNPVMQKTTVLLFGAWVLLTGSLLARR